MNVAFPSIKQYREVIREYWKLGYRGRVELVGYPKAHGTCAQLLCPQPGVVIPAGKTQCWTDELKDGYGFYDYVQENQDSLVELAVHVQASLNCQYPFTITGEWVGEGIQHGSSLASLSRRLLVFGVAEVYPEPETGTNKLRFIDHSSMSFDFPAIAIYDIRHTAQYKLTINLEFPELSQNALAEITESVEADCPIAGYFGTQSDRGEGVVWHHATDFDRHLWFKVKGKKHSSSKVRVLAKVNPEQINSILEFIDYAVTENRLEQAASTIGPICNENRAAFLKWLHGDIIKEESDTLAANGLTHKDVANRITSKAMTWYSEKMK